MPGRCGPASLMPSERSPPRDRTAARPASRPRRRQRACTRGISGGRDTPTRGISGGRERPTRGISGAVIHCSVLTPVCANASLAQCVCSPRERREQLPPPAPARTGHEAAACRGRGRPRQGERGRPQRLSADICTYSQCILQNHRFIFPKCAFIKKLVFFNERNLETNSEKTTEFSYKRFPSTGSTTTLSHPKPSSPSNTRDHGSEAAGAAMGRHGAAPGARWGRARHGSGRAACFPGRLFLPREDSEIRNHSFQKGRTENITPSNGQMCKRLFLRKKGLFHSPLNHFKMQKARPAPPAPPQNSVFQFRF